MDNEMIKATVDLNIIKYSLDDFEMKPHVKKHLLQFERYFQECISTIESSLSALDSINLSVRGVCSGSQVGKSTVYENRDTLGVYLENRSKEIEEEYDILSNRNFSKMESKIKDLNQRLNSMVIDYIEFQNLKIMMEEVLEQNDKLQKKLAIQAEERVNLIKQNNELNNDLTKQKNKVIELVEK